MAEYSSADGVSGQVEGEAYCMKKSWNARNIDEMNNKMGYHNMSDLANTPKPATEGAKNSRSNPQLGPKADSPMHNDRS